MGRRAAEEEANHWPGFVDALSTIVMVVTFLLIILAIAVAAISQQVAKSYIISESQKTEMGGGDKKTDKRNNASSEFRGVEKVEIPSEIKDAAQSSNSSASSSNPAETKVQTPIKSDPNAIVKAELGNPISEDDGKETKDPLAVVSRKTLENEKRIQIASSDAEPAAQSEKIMTAKSKAVLTLEFDAITIKIDDVARSEIDKFIVENDLEKVAKKVTIWSFGSSLTGSISEAKRAAYYRALSARNSLLNNGYDASQIGMQIRVAQAETEHNIVRIVVNE